MWMFVLVLSAILSIVTFGLKKMLQALIVTLLVAVVAVGFSTVFSPLWNNATPAERYLLVYNRITTFLSSPVEVLIRAASGGSPFDDEAMLRGPQRETPPPSSGDGGNLAGVRVAVALEGPMDLAPTVSTSLRTFLSRVPALVGIRGAFALFLGGILWVIGKQTEGVLAAVALFFLSFFFSPMVRLARTVTFGFQLVPTLVLAALVAGFLVFYAYPVAMHSKLKLSRYLRSWFLIDPDKERREEGDIKFIQGKLKKLAERMSEKLRGPERLVEAMDDSVRRGKYLLGFAVELHRSRVAPLEVDEQELNEHVLVLGASGSGKTKSILCPLAYQMIKSGSGLIFLTFKRDPSAAIFLKETAEEAGKNFIYFSLSPEERSARWNPIGEGDPGALAERLILSLDLPQGGDAQYYTNVQRNALISVLEGIRQFSNGSSVNLYDLLEIISSRELLKILLKKPITEDQEKNLEGLKSNLSSMCRGSVVAGRITPPDGGILLSEVIKRGDVMFFNLESGMNPKLSEYLGKMLVFTMRYICSFRSELDRMFYLLVDEFQDIVCEGFRDLLLKMRSSRVGIVMATQGLGNLEGLRVGGNNLLNAVMTNTAIKVVLQNSNPKEISVFAEMSGTERITEKSERVLSKEGGHLTQNDAPSDDIMATRYTGDGAIVWSKKYSIDPNVFLTLPKGLGVVYRRGQIPQLSAFGLPFDPGQYTHRSEMFRLPSPRPEEAVHSDAFRHLRECTPSRDGGGSPLGRSPSVQDVIKVIQEG